jgi:hypothetical protein
MLLPLPDDVPERDLRQALARVKEDLSEFKLLPFSDAKAPSLVSIVAGSRVVGSWWGHPAGPLIYRVGEALDSDPNVLLSKLWRGKLTLIDRSLWPALVRIGRARGPWQMTGMSTNSTRVLEEIDGKKAVRITQIPPESFPGSRSVREGIRDLEQRLLILTRSVHTSSGAHALEGESWSAWSRRMRTPHFSGSVVSAQLALEKAAERLSPGVQPRRMFPWGRSFTRAPSRGL